MFAGSEQGWKKRCPTYPLLFGSQQETVDEIRTALSNALLGFPITGAALSRYGGTGRSCRGVGIRVDMARRAAFQSQPLDHPRAATATQCNRKAYAHPAPRHRYRAPAPVPSAAYP